MPSQREKTQRIEARINERLADGVRSIDQIDQIYGIESMQPRSSKGIGKRRGEGRDFNDVSVFEPQNR
jgi:hypothetical protein